ncbi:MAG: hypothetical protein JOY93_07685 [Acidobacteriales bacterium]|nr:hypothetical protein [Terriglobales bacterium]
MSAEINLGHQAMKRFGNYSISRKLTALNLLVSAAALLLACVSFFLYDLHTFQVNIARNLSIQAQITGSNTVSAVTFNDARSAETTLQALRASSHIIYAGIYTSDGRVFAQYWRDRPEEVPSYHPIPAGEVEAHWFTPSEIGLVRSIVFQGKPAEMVYIRSDLKQMSDRLRNYAVTILGVLFISLLAALLVSRIAQRVVSGPLMHLVDTAQVVSREQNYSVRAASTGGHDEVAALIGAFNEMLAQIQKRDTALQEAHDELEARVKERTTDLKVAEENLSALSNRLLLLRDEERRHIARELHDGSGQVVAALAMNLSILEKDAAHWNARTQKALADSVQLVKTILQDLRTMSYLLHPPLLDEAGLELALRLFTEGFAERSNIPVSLEVAPNLGRLSKELETAIFRIVQECLTNIHRHSGSANARIQITRTHREVCVEVRDQGKGMQAEAGRPPRPGVGIPGMHERVRQLGGRLEIKSGTAGTVVMAIIPVEDVGKVSSGSREQFTTQA